VTNPSNFQASGVGGDQGDSSVVLALSQLAGQPNGALNNQTLSQNYSSAVDALGSALASVNDQSTNSAAVTQMLTTQRSSVSGVSTDQEMTNLLQFQKAYQASAEFITTLNEMLQTLTAMKTV
jgi:flagellar hook-associated protein 1 FlgK